MSGIIGSRLNIRGSGLVGSLGTDGQHLLSSGAGVTSGFETVADATYDDDKVINNIALLGFKMAVNGDLVKYNLQDQIIDEYEDGSGIDAGASTNETLVSATYYKGSGSNLTLQSTDTTAEVEPDYADMVMLIEDAHGTATLNTDIKGYISEDSGTTFTQGTLAQEGTWGTNKKILAFHDLDISAQSGTSMCYKIETLNQSAGSKETYIHATSIGWKE